MDMRDLLVAASCAPCFPGDDVAGLVALEAESKFEREKGGLRGEIGLGDVG